MATVRGSGFRSHAVHGGGDYAHQGGAHAYRKGRGAVSNSSGRYEIEQRVAAQPVDGEEEPLRTEVIFEKPRRVITYNKSPYVGFDRSINPYRGCEHGCVYCFARPTHAYVGLSPGLDFETKIFAKPDAPKLLEAELARPGYRPRPVALGTNTDPYQPIERRLRIMRGLLEVFSRTAHPVTILTKSALITRDLDILAPMANERLTRAMVSITTKDGALARAMEPRASAPARRFEAVRALVEAGVETGVMAGPMIPGLNDHELEGLFEEGADAGASFIAYTIIRLPLEVAPLFQEWLETHAPTRAGRVMRHIRENNGGRLYDPNWSRGGEMKGPYAKMIALRYAAVAKRLGIDNQRRDLDVSKFRPPGASRDQLSLFDESSG